MPLGYWEKKFVLVTGGSSGLGLHIAKAFGRKGARPILAARGAKGLSEARSVLADESIECDTIQADVCDPAQAKKAVDYVIQHHGSLDVLVNNVGVSTRIKVSDAGSDEYKKLMDVNFYSAVNCTLPAIPHLTEASGHIVNIGSLASKTAWPYMSPYSASKFALAAFSHQLRLELPNNLHVMLVCPGPIERGDSQTRYSSQGLNVPEDALKPGGGAKLKGIDPEWLCAKIVNACKKRRAELIVPSKSKILFSLSALNARLGDWIIKKKKES